MSDLHDFDEGSVERSGQGDTEHADIVGALRVSGDRTSGGTLDDLTGSDATGSREASWQRRTLLHR
jgi:hypothetical protein